MDHVDHILAQWRHERPDLDVSAMGVVGRLGRLARHLGREMEKTFAAHGLTPPGFDVLATLRRSGAPYALSPGELMASMMVTSGTVTNRLDQLEKAGLITRERNPADARGAIITLTPHGLSLIDRVVEAHVATQNRLVAALPQEDRAALDALLRRLLGALEP